MERLSVEDLLLIGEAVLDVPAERLARTARLATAAVALAAPFAAEHGRERHVTLAAKAAVLCARLVRDRPLRHGNERVALVAMLELVARNHGIWQPPAGGQEELADAVGGLAAGTLTEEAFASWVGRHVRER